MDTLNEIEECLKNECFLQINDFGSVSMYGDLTALARLIQRLIIMHPMSYPDEPEMGVGIESYEFEFMDNITLSELTDKIKNQIDKYIPNSFIGNILVDVIDTDKSGKKNTIGVLVNLTKTKDDKNNMILTFDKVGKTGKIESKIYI